MKSIEKVTAGGKTNDKVNESHLQFFSMS